MEVWGGAEGELGQGVLVERELRMGKWVGREGGIINGVVRVEGGWKLGSRLHVHPLRGSRQGQGSRGQRRPRPLLRGGAIVRTGEP